MADDNDKINPLLAKLEKLLKRQDNFSIEINELREEIIRLKDTQIKKQFEENQELTSCEASSAAIVEPAIKPVTSIYQTYQQKIAEKQPKNSDSEPNYLPENKSDLEKFIGENLINKIGIAITVIGVGIGAKYSIEHDLISPLTRIILGYLMGLGLLGFGIKLKKNYENYSAVLVSGAMAIMYFITYSAYSFYELIPQPIAFSIMVLFTGFTVVAAISYNQQVIAHVGLVGAYAVPFLLSDGSGKIAILFSYMALINLGILFIAFKKYWKPLYYASFILSWLIYFSWYSTKFQTIEHFELALTFLLVFFFTFYSVFLSYKLLRKEKFEDEDIMLLLANSFIFYGIGYSILTSNESANQLLGLFTLCNAIVHFGVSILIARQQLNNKNLFYLVTGLVLTFITIAIPVQLNGNWVTLFWACEAALLFWIGRTKHIQFYESLAYILIILAFLSIVQDWKTVYSLYNPKQPETRLLPIMNINFITSLLVIICFGFISTLYRNPKYTSPIATYNELSGIVSFLIPVTLLIVLYNSFRMEITTFWNQLYIDSAIEVKNQNASYIDNYIDTDLLKFKTIWVINYSLFFMALLSFANIKKFRNSNLGYINLVLNTIVLLVFLIQGLYLFGQLRDSYLSQSLAEYYQRSSFNIGIRYISFAFVVLILIATYKYTKQDFIKTDSLDFKQTFDLLLFTSILWIASSELISLMDIMKFSQSYKLGLTILWGVYSLIIIALGIWKKKKHLRISAIVLFAITLIKLFVYDISHLDTIAKTIVFVSLGILLLIISFLYHKYKHMITDEPEH